MKIISLNIWGGRVYESLLDFLKNHNEIDIFCLQEVYHDAEGKELIYLDAKLNIYKDIEKILVNYRGYYRPHLKDYYGLAIFVKKDLDVLEEGEHYVHREKGYVPTDHVGFHAKNVQYLKVRENGDEVVVLNFHGLWNGNGKTDTEHRINQSQNIKDFMDGIKGKKILCGDFNLLPDTQSLAILDGGMKNLVKEYGVQSTRSELYTKPVKFADYILVSPEVRVEDFEVLPDVVSDHLPLFLDFS